MMVRARIRSRSRFPPQLAIRRVASVRHLSIAGRSWQLTRRALFADAIAIGPVMTDRRTHSGEDTPARAPTAYAFAERWSVAPEGSVSTTLSPSPASPDARHQRVRGSFYNRLDRTQALNLDPLSRPFAEEVAGGARSSARILGGSSMSNRGLRRDEWSEEVGQANVIFLDDGSFEVATDPRGDGSALAG
jgi:hypothetical protein